MAKRVRLKGAAPQIKLYRKRVLAVTIGMFILILCLITRLFWLQVIEHNQYTTLSNQNQLSLLPIAPNRGLIYDRNSILLAKNDPVFSLEVIPDKVKNLSLMLKKLETFIPLSQEELKQFYRQLRNHRPFDLVPLKLALTPQQVAKFSVNQYYFPGFVIKARLMREYPYGSAMAHVVGYVGRINARELARVNATNYSATNFIGKIGIEKYYENLLHGTVGYQQVETDASGRIVRVISRTPPIPGDNLYLTINMRLQIAAEEALGDHDGSIVAIDPANGQVLALISAPSFNPNLFVDGISEKLYQALQDAPSRPLFDRAMRGEFPFGSTIKPFISLEGLQTKTVTPGYTIYDPGWYKLPNSSHIFHDWAAWGWVNLEKAIIVSCDTYYYILAHKMGIHLIDKVLHEFGFGQKTGIDLPGELSGLIPSPAWKERVIGHPWYPGDTIISGIGQGYMLTTPIQLASATATLAEHGIRYQPHVLLKYQLPNGQMVVVPPHQLPTIRFDKAWWNLVVKAMTGVATSPDGTAVSAFRNAPYSVAIKTGTAQVVSLAVQNSFAPNKIPKRFLTNSLAIAFAPANDPKIAIAVIVEHAPHTAIFVARKVLDEYLIREHHDPNIPLTTQS